jgi:diguanylate cyclase (GGDEF)-like protein
MASAGRSAQTPRRRTYQNLPSESTTHPSSVAGERTVSVALAARILGVHPNTVRTWTEQGRLPVLRINARGDRRYRVADLEVFLLDAEQAPGLPGVQRDSRPTGAIAGRSSGDLADRRSRELRVLGEIAQLTAHVTDLDTTLHRICQLLREAFDYRLVGIGQLRDGAVMARVAHGVPVDRVPAMPLGSGIVGTAVAERRTMVVPDVRLEPRYSEIVHGVATEIVVPIEVRTGTWGCIHVADTRIGALTRDDVGLFEAVAHQIAAAIETVGLMQRLERQLELAEALRRVSTDISSKLELEAILAETMDQATTLFGADRAAIYRLRGDGAEAPVARGLSERYLQRVAALPSPSLARLAMETGEALYATDYADDPRGSGVREAVIEEGFDTVAVAPLVADGRPLGALALYHDRRRPWSDPELEALKAIAAQASIAIQNAGTYAQMARWAAQLQSIQQLGTRLDRMSSVSEIGMAIAVELQQLIDYHNVRVYRVVGDDCLPVAWRGNIGEYTDEVEDELRLKVGEGITGWVAAHGVAQYLPDANADDRAQTIVGTSLIDESMLIAPLIFEQRVMGVIVLSKLGLHQFAPDDLRLLEIYASLAAQAMANADATEQLRAQSETLERQLRSQRELVRMTESIFASLDPRVVLDEIATRLAGLIPVDNIGIDKLDRVAGEFVPVVARGVDEVDYRGRRLKMDEGVAGWVAEHGEGQLVLDELADPRVAPFANDGPEAGSLIVVPLRGREGTVGVLTLERLGTSAVFTTEEFELVQLFAAQASIAMQNAELHADVVIQAQTDGLTGLLNHATFTADLERAVAGGEGFGLIMLDLDDFKGFNDTLGHPTGDLLLKGIARALGSAGRGSDRAYRYGGDEFALILPGTDGAGARAVADRVRRAIHEEGGLRGGSGAMAVTCSTGVAAYPDDGADAAAMLGAADRACFLAKRTGRDRIATAVEAAAVGEDLVPTAPTPIDMPSASSSAA